MDSIYTNVPYTYLIGWSKFNTWYYGVQYGKKCHPDNLWVTYFTSSRHVKEFRELNGEPDIIEVRHIFDSKEAAQKWEITCISKLGMVKSVKWLNRKEPGKGWDSTAPGVGAKISEGLKIANAKPEVKARRSTSAKNKPPATAETLKNMSIAQQKRPPRTDETWAKHAEGNRRRGPRSAETCEKLRIAFLGTTKDDEIKERTRDTMLAAKRRWYNNGEITLFLGATDLIPPGFALGRKLKVT